jgi:hypothetical protein
MSKMPGCTLDFFWDVKTSDLDTETDWFFIIERLLEYGDDRSLEWLKKKYSDSQIMDVVKKSRKLSRKTVNAWRLYYSLNPEDVLCSKMCCNQDRKAFWDY